MERIFTELKSLIDEIQTEYDKVTEQWLTHQERPINLKKTIVADVETENAIYYSILAYVQLLTETGTDFVLQFSTECSSKVTARIKTQNSIEYKIHNYKTERHEFGKVPINKCVNDLFGVRIVLDVPLTFEQITTFIENTYNGKYKCIDSSKNDYVAVHLYFRKNNQSFPWELQIWNPQDAENNLLSHKKYKQGYTDWENVHTEGGKPNG